MISADNIQLTLLAAALGSVVMNTFVEPADTAATASAAPQVRALQVSTAAASTRVFVPVARTSTPAAPVIDAPVARVSNLDVTPEIEALDPVSRVRTGIEATACLGCTARADMRWAAR